MRTLKPCSYQNAHSRGKPFEPKIRSNRNPIEQKTMSYRNIKRQVMQRNGNKLLTLFADLERRCLVDHCFWEVQSHSRMLAKARQKFCRGLSKLRLGFWSVDAMEILRSRPRAPPKAWPSQRHTSHAELAAARRCWNVET